MQRGGYGGSWSSGGYLKSDSVLERTLDLAKGVVSVQAHNRQVLNQQQQNGTIPEEKPNEANELSLDQTNLMAKAQQSSNFS